MDILSENFYSFRCKQCNKLLAMNVFGSFEIKCMRCGTLNILLQKMAEQVIVTDPEGVIVFANNQVEKITGYTINEVIGKKPSLWSGQMTPEFYQNMWRMISKEKIGVALRLTNRHKSGYLYNVLLQVSPVLDTQGNIKFFIGFESLINKKSMHRDS
ncbi:MAG: hypothetical protein A2908_03525 [Candidatus Staskawiczbacteria bacterium RIFCSPLOWO2_01_FULL_38_12b]|uniref:PAS domain-containing protein n=1 Tax=Candidatus Staskawiczbacteria bacterium RIFCSPLOWO2_01_FULL_38_12b TaxID=1802214 RepID=A0A1G2ICX7_9BACT|nr:MAG: hypothetical protein A2908_03525 [Candidatus Staskawiczbacteria bacterium RIFCSPLOWO2_01_FULL_38_12b]